MKSKCHELADDVKLRHPDVSVDMIGVANSGACAMELMKGKKKVHVEFRPDLGFGISPEKPNDDFMVGHDVWLQNVDEAATHVISLLKG